jgi:GNAT superfamily N-acetyltransferase
VTSISRGAKDYFRAQRALRAEVYRDDPLYRDATTPLLTMLLNPAGCCAAGADIVPVAIPDEDEHVVATCLFILASGLPDTLQIAFFEALPDQEQAIELLVETAKQTARALGATRIVAGMNGHVNNGLGFLAGPWDAPASFGSAYNPPYYVDYFRPHASSEGKMSAYSYRIPDLTFAREQRILERVKRHFTFRTGRFHDMHSEIATYTYLNNRCFDAHPLYFERSPEEDHELFMAFYRFLNEENFLIAELDGEPVGFLLWYPDFNELIEPGKSIGTGTLLKYRVLRRRIKKVKLAELGVLPQYWGAGLILGLLDKGASLAHGKHATVETGWVFEANLKSKGLASRWAREPCRHFSFFEIHPEPV